MITTDELQKLKDELPLGWSSKIAKTLGVSRSYVSQVLNGNGFNAKIISEAIKLRNQKREELGNIKKEL